jgi:hypothetical protein
VVSAPAEYLGRQIPDIMTDVLDGFPQSFPPNAIAMP